MTVGLFAVDRRTRELGWFRYPAAALVMLTATLGASGLSWLGLSEANVVLTFLAGAVLCGAWFGRGPGLAASLVGVLLFDFFFTRPHYTLAVEDTEYLLTFCVMAAITVGISDLTARIRRQKEAAELREQRSNALYRFTDQLSAARNRNELTRIAEKHFREILQSKVCLVLPGGDVDHFGDSSLPEGLRSEALDLLHSSARGPRGAAASVGQDSTLLPLEAGDACVGGLVIGRDLVRAPFGSDLRELIDALCSQLALALQRDLLSSEARAAQLEVEAERARNALLSSVSHDLRTPLAGIAGASSTLLIEGPGLDPGTARLLLENIYSEAERLVRLVNNLLRMAQIESGNLRVTKEWQPVEEVLGSALHRMETQLSELQIDLDLAPDLPLVALDGVLVEQILINLLDNAARFAGPGGTLRIGIRPLADEVIFEIQDDGPGIPPGAEERIFEKFVRVGPTQSKHAGLGLAICRAVVGAHGGWIRAWNHSSGGACFAFALPLGGSPPAVPESWAMATEMEE